MVVMINVMIQEVDYSVSEEIETKKEKLLVKVGVIVEETKLVARVTCSNI